MTGLWLHDLKSYKEEMPGSSMAERVVLGLSEPIKIIVDGREHPFPARIDTGATGSSIDFNLAVKLRVGPIMRSKLVKSVTGIKKRPLVKLKIKVKSITLEDDFTIADRSSMSYPLLIGQNILRRGNFLIDPTKH